MKRSIEGDETALGKRPREGFSQEAVAAQVAMEKAKTDQLLKNMVQRPGTQESKASQDSNVQSREVSVSKKIVEHLMTAENRQVLTEETGAEVEWHPERHRVKLSGSDVQLKQAARLVARVEMHCHWGSSEKKVRRLLRRPQVESVLLRLSPMTANKLRQLEKTLNSKDSTLRIGKEKQCDVIIEDSLVSRQHCLISFDHTKGSVYIADLSTNGTYLNGLRLPSKKLGKVILMHGDELLLHNPESGDPEFGYICNLTELSVRPETKLQAPRRLLTADELSSSRPLGDFS